LRTHAPDIADALATMEREHREHDALLAQLIPAWAALSKNPAERKHTRAAAARLRALLEDHLAAEERLVIPALAKLSEAERRAVAAEMRARRV
jgi:hypothetical protein